MSMIFCPTLSFPPLIKNISCGFSTKICWSQLTMNLKVLDQLFGFDSDHELIFAKLSLKKFLVGENKYDTAVCCDVHRNRKLLHFSTRNPGIPEHQLVSRIWAKSKFMLTSCFLLTWLNQQSGQMTQPSDTAAWPSLFPSLHLYMSCHQSPWKSENVTKLVAIIFKDANLEPKCSRFFCSCWVLMGKDWHAKVGDEGLLG